MFKLHYAILACAMLALTACGGGSSSSSAANAESSSWDIYDHLASNAVAVDLETSSIMHYDFENVSGTTVPDLSGRGNDADFTAYNGTSGSVISAGYRGNGILTS